LTVSDTGCGMDSATQARIFDPFFTTKAPGEGTGLGLAVVHGVIKNHGGAITVSSEPGVGATFSVYLPVSDCQASPVVQNSVLLPRGNGEHILFVDDEEALVSVGKSMLEQLGYRVTARTDSGEALAAFRAEPGDFDLIITDQIMPQMDGADLARALLQIRPTLPVILTTGYSTSMSPEKAKAIGIGELLLKPNTMQTLGDAIRRALSYTT
jgi:CheY-like chemotaxis protein